MSNLAIRCEGLSKRYRIGAAHERYKALRDVISDAATAPFRRIRASRNGHGNSNGHHPPATQLAMTTTTFGLLTMFHSRSTRATSSV